MRFCFTFVLILDISSIYPLLTLDRLHLLVLCPDLAQCCICFIGLVSDEARYVARSEANVVKSKSALSLSISNTGVCAPTWLKKDTMEAVSEVATRSTSPRFEFDASVATRLC